jgi:3-oxoacyl-[acyl-carrier protein] reductase
MKSFRGKKALITGAGSGIGQAIAWALAREGADLWLIGRDRTRLDATADTARQLGVEVVVETCDLAQPGQIAEAVRAVLARWPYIDILVNNAGLAYYGPVQQTDDTQWADIFAVNLLAPVALTRALLPVLQARDEAHVLNVASIFGLVQMRKGAAYQTSKFGLVGFSTALAAEVGNRRLGVTTLCPGFVRTPMLDHYATGMGQPRHRIPSWASTSAEHVADAAIHAMRARKAIVVLPWTARLMWWAFRLAPNGMSWLMREGWRK